MRHFQLALIWNKKKKKKIMSEERLGLTVHGHKKGAHCVSVCRAAGVLGSRAFCQQHEYGGGQGWPPWPAVGAAGGLGPWQQWGRPRCCPRVSTASEPELAWRRSYGVWEASPLAVSLPSAGTASPSAQTGSSGCLSWWSGDSAWAAGLWCLRPKNYRFLV